MASIKIKSLKLSKLIALRCGEALRKKGGPKMKVLPYGLLKTKEIKKRLGSNSPRPLNVVEK